MAETLPIVFLVLLVVLLLLGVVALVRISASGHAGRAHGVRSPAGSRQRALGTGQRRRGIAHRSRRRDRHIPRRDAEAAHRHGRPAATAVAGIRRATRRSSPYRTSSGSRPCARSVEQRLDVLRTDNAAKLEQMRATVDEKLQATLEQRLGESFKIVSDRLEQVHRGLGEMQSLAAGVGDLKRVLSNVKTRGMWGEVQLAALLAEVLTPQQYATNVETVPDSEQARRIRDPPSRKRRRRPAMLAAGRRQVSARRMAEAAGRAGTRRRARGRHGAQGARGLPARAGAADPRILRRAAVHHRFRDPVRADRGALRRNDGARGICRDAAARVSRHADRADEFPGAAQQPADGLSHARHRAAVQRSLEGAGRGQDGVREVRRHHRQDQGQARPGEQDARRDRRAQPRDRAPAARCRIAAGCGIADAAPCPLSLLPPRDDPPPEAK